MGAKSRTFTEAQAAIQIGIGASTLSKLRRAGRVPSWRQIGRRVLYTPEDVDRFIAAKQTGEIVKCEQFSERRLTEARLG